MVARTAKQVVILGGTGFIGRRLVETLGLQGKIGTLIQGAEADIVLFELKEEPVTFKDVRGIPIQGNLLFKPETIIKGGQEIAAEQLS